MNRENLVKLRDWLKANQITFRMSCRYRYDIAENGHFTSVPFRSIEDCGNYGSPLGWAPFVPGLEVVTEDFKDNELDFLYYCKRIFDLDEFQYKFLFSSDWNADYSPTHYFFERVDLLLKDERVGEKLWYCIGNEGQYTDLEFYEDFLDKFYRKEHYYDKY